MARHALVVSTALLAMAAAAPANAVLILSSSVSLEAHATLGFGADIIQDSDLDEASQGATIDPLSASVSALVTIGETSIEARASVSATWAAATEGQVLFDDVGHIIDTTSEQPSSAYTNLPLLSGNDWQYVFEATDSGEFVLDYSIFADPISTQPGALNGINFVWIADGIGAGEALFVDTAGTLTRDLVAGTQYTVGLQNRENILLGGGPGVLPAQSTALMDAIFDWSVVYDGGGPGPVSVPEPATLTLLLTGMLAGAGLGRRRRRRPA